MTISNDDLLEEISPEQLLELSDLQGSYALDQTVIDDATRDAISFIESFILIPADPTPLLHKIAVDLAVLELRRKNKLLSDEDKQRSTQIEGWLTKMARGTMPTTVAQSKSSAKRDVSFAFRTSQRKLERRS